MEANHAAGRTKNIIYLLAKQGTLMQYPRHNFKFQP